MRSFDVLLVNPIRDGFNLVASEGPLINLNHGGLVLSRNAGIAEQLAQDARLINPFDATETAAAIRQALEEPAGEREGRHERLCESLLKNNPAIWLARQLAWFGRS